MRYILLLTFIVDFPLKEEYYKIFIMVRLREIDENLQNIYVNETRIGEAH